MKKFLLFAGILAFMGCSSDDSNSGNTDGGQAVLPPTTKNVLLVGHDYMSQIDIRTGEVRDIDVKGAHFEFPYYDEGSKKLYDLTQNEILTLDFSSNSNSKNVFKREFTPGFVEYMEGNTLLDNSGNLWTYFYRGYEHGEYSSFYKINLTEATNRIENGSQQLNKLLSTDKKSIFSYTFNNKKDKLYALLREMTGENTAKYSLLVLNPNDLEDYDENTAQKTIALPTSFGSDKNGYGFFVDKNENVVFITSSNKLVQFDLMTRKETLLYQFSDAFIGDVVYEKKTHNIYYLELDKDRKKYVRLVIVNLDNKASVVKELKFKNQEEIELTSLLMVDPF
ncbi:hypothetical protein [Myroides odoratimimus]|uniref:hypothetical protein n=1 Tax=Myroides odoratimimus TaxID=76832 RepID=UPI00310186F8